MATIHSSLASSQQTNVLPLSSNDLSLSFSMAWCVQKCVVVRHHAFITNSDASNKLQVSQKVELQEL